jgi:8-oxo-dGTP pyrophosphatase MutT (NUDIX family)
MMGVFRPVVTDDDLFLRCTDVHTIIEHALPHRTVWGMVFNPRQRLWLVQWRRPDKDVCPNLWDISCGGHVDCVAGAPEAYAVAYERELREELGLRARFLRGAPPSGESAQDPETALTLDLGHTREYHVYPGQGGKTQLEREHVQMFLSLYDGAVTLLPDGEPQGLAWMSGEKIREQLLYRERATPGLEIMLRRCEAVLRSREG